MYDSSPGDRGQLKYLCAAAAMLLAALLGYSLTRAFAWDEGFHLVAAQLILAGKRPYLDFCFPQTPLNAYLTAGWMRLFGETWRAAHVLETLCVAAAAFLTADFVRARFPVPEWRWAGALAALVAVGMNAQVVIFGTIGQSYGLSLFLVVAAFRLAVVAVERKGASRAAAAGFMAGAAAGCSLLTAPVLGSGYLALSLQSRGQPLAKIAAFLAGSGVAWLPIAWLYRQGPAQTLFNIVLYQLRYRHKWNGAVRQDIGALSSWINSAQGLSWRCWPPPALVLDPAMRLAARAPSGILPLALVGRGTVRRISHGPSHLRAIFSGNGAVRGHPRDRRTLRGGRASGRTRRPLHAAYF